MDGTPPSPLTLTVPGRGFFKVLSFPIPSYTVSNTHNVFKWRRAVARHQQFLTIQSSWHRRVSQKKVPTVCHCANCGTNSSSFDSLCLMGGAAPRKEGGLVFSARGRRPRRLTNPISPVTTATATTATATTTTTTSGLLRRSSPPPPPPSLFLVCGQRASFT